MSNIPCELLEIKDEEARRKAVILWMSGLTDEQRQELSGDLQELFTRFQHALEPVRVAVRQIVEAVQWLDDNPHIKAYLRKY